MKARRVLARAVAVASAVLLGLVVSIVVAPPANADPPGTVQATVGETGGSYLVGFCLPPAHPVADSPNCSDSTPLLGLTSVSGGSWTSVSLPPATYNAALADAPGSGLSPYGPVTVLASQTIGCTFTRTAAPACGGTGTVVATAADASGTFLTGFCTDPAHPVAASPLCSDSTALAGLRSLSAGDSVSISLPALHYLAALADGTTVGPNGPVYVAPGGTVYCNFTMTAAPACSTSSVTFSSATGAGNVTITAPDGTYAITGVTNTGPPYSPAPPAGATLPVGVLGFSVTLPPGVTTADVQVILPAGSAPTSYFKLHAGAWLDYTSHATIVGDTVTLHLVDGDAFDADSSVNGVIVDPGFPSSGYRFTGFRPPVDNVDVNKVKAGQTIPIKWHLTDASGAPVSDPGSIASLTSDLCKGGDETKVSPVTLVDKGDWQASWKTPKAYANQCRTLTLTLNDGTSHRATFVFS